MQLSFDLRKDAENIRKHGISLQRAEEMNFEASALRIDDRMDYGETRFQAIGFIGATLHTFVFTMRDEVVRAISLRKSDKHEARHYAEEF